MDRIFDIVAIHSYIRVVFLNMLIVQWKYRKFIWNSGKVNRTAFNSSGADPRGVHPARAPLKLEKIWYFGVKSWFFTRNTPKMFAPPSAIGKIMIFFVVKSWFFTRNAPKFFAPPSARRDFYKCAPPPNLKSWIRPWRSHIYSIWHTCPNVHKHNDLNSYII
jgi:hypothetical protein